MIRRPKAAARGDALARRPIAQWRRITARLQVLMNTGTGNAALAAEAHALRRQCERLAGELGGVAEAALSLRLAPVVPSAQWAAPPCFHASQRVALVSGAQIDLNPLTTEDSP